MCHSYYLTTLDSGVVTTLSAEMIDRKRTLQGDFVAIGLLIVMVATHSVKLAYKC